MPLGTNDRIEFGTPSGEVTWRRRSRRDSSISEDHGPINAGGFKPDAVEKPGAPGSGKSLAR